MALDETGGGDRQFPETTWGFVQRLGASLTIEQRQGFETLCRRYWKPIFHYVRATRRRTVEDAKDLTQSFLAWMLEKDVLARYSPEGGAFRAYLKVLLKRFLIDHDRTGRRIKRGGGNAVLTIDESMMADEHAASPGEALDRAWARELMTTALETVRGRLELRDQGPWFRVYERLKLDGDGAGYEEVGRELGLSRSQVQHAMKAVKRELQQAVKDEIRSTVASEEALGEEWRHLFGR